MSCGAARDSRFLASLRRARNDKYIKGGIAGELLLLLLFVVKAIGADELGAGLDY